VREASAAAHIRSSEGKSASVGPSWVQGSQSNLAYLRNFAKWPLLLDRTMANLASTAEMLRAVVQMIEGARGRWHPPVHACKTRVLTIFLSALTGGLRQTRDAESNDFGCGVRRHCHFSLWPTTRRGEFRSWRYVFRLFYLRFQRPSLVR
jgi:hypothetical protein